MYFTPPRPTDSVACGVAAASPAASPAPVTARALRPCMSWEMAPAALISVSDTWATAAPGRAAVEQSTPIRKQRRRMAGEDLGRITGVVSASWTKV